jgi:hypothetical protein
MTEPSHFVSAVGGTAAFDTADKRREETTGILFDGNER